jgi:hypothetical protein
MGDLVLVGTANATNSRHAIHSIVTIKGVPKFLVTALPG